MLTSQDVVTAYKLVLGREPESPVVVQNFVDHSNFDHLRRALLGSGEFAERLSRDPHLLAVPIAALTMTEEVRRYKRRLEALVALALPISDKSVLVVGDEPASLADFFLDRRCKVSIATSAETAGLFERILPGRHLEAANTAIVSHDFSNPVDGDAVGRHDLVYGELPDDDSDVMRTWLDNVAEACAGTLILTARTAPGRSEDVFVTPVPDKPSTFRTVPTKRWVFQRLRERFEHLYDPMRVVSELRAPRGDFGGAVETHATYVASRDKLSSPVLEEYVVGTPRSRSSGNGAARATGM